jgi:hypothetical protein
VPEHIDDLIKRPITLLTDGQMLAVGKETTIRIADHMNRHDYAFHSDGEPCMKAMTSRNCGWSHRYGRTFEESH